MAACIAAHAVTFFPGIKVVVFNKKIHIELKKNQFIKIKYSFYLYGNNSPTQRRIIMKTSLFEKVLKVVIYTVVYIVFDAIIDHYLEWPVQSKLIEMSASTSLNENLVDFICWITYWKSQWSYEYDFTLSDYCCFIVMIYLAHDYLLKKVMRIE